MTPSSIYDSKQIVPHRVAGYIWKDSTLQNGVYISSAAEARGDVGVITSIPDMVKWDAAMNDNSLLTEASRQQMFTPGKLTIQKNISPFSKPQVASFLARTIVLAFNNLHLHRIPINCFFHFRTGITK